MHAWLRGDSDELMLWLDKWHSKMYKTSLDFTIGHFTAAPVILQDGAHASEAPCACQRLTLPISGITYRLHEITESISSGLWGQTIEDLLTCLSQPKQRRRVIVCQYPLIMAECYLISCDCGILEVNKKGRV